MKKLIDYVKTAIVMASAPAIVAAQSPNYAESARRVYDHVQKNGRSAVYQLGQREISAQYWQLPPDTSDKTRFYAFELNGVRYLVESKVLGNSVRDYIDSAPTAGSPIDGTVNELTEQIDGGPKRRVDLSNADLRNAVNSNFGSTASLAYTMIRLESLPKLEPPPRPNFPPLPPTPR